MGYISTKRTLTLRRLQKVQSQLNNLYNTLDEMAATGAQSYTFDSGEGSQKTVRRSLKQIHDLIRQLEATEDHLINKLYDMGLVNVRLRRKTPHGNYR
jgi:hypothetical protein